MKQPALHVFQVLLFSKDLVYQFALQVTIHLVEIVSNVHRHVQYAHQLMEAVLLVLHLTYYMMEYAMLLALQLYFKKSIMLNAKNANLLVQLVQLIRITVLHAYALIIRPITICL